MAGNGRARCESSFAGRNLSSNSPHDVLPRRTRWRKGAMPAGSISFRPVQFRQALRPATDNDVALEPAALRGGRVRAGASHSTPIFIPRKHTAMLIALVGFLPVFLSRDVCVIGGVIFAVGYASAHHVDRGTGGNHTSDRDDYYGKCNSSHPAHGMAARAVFSDGNLSIVVLSPPPLLAFFSGTIQTGFLKACHSHAGEAKFLICVPSLRLVDEEMPKTGILRAA